MPLSLHAAFVPTAIQVVRATRSLADKAESFSGEGGIGESEMFTSRLIEDMFPLPFQFYSVFHHTANALDGVRAGVFNPPSGDMPGTFDAARALMDRAIAALEAVSEDEMEGWIGQPMRFEMGDFKLPFTAENFLLSFSQPNYMFHAATVYDIMRMRGVQLGKRDFMGRLRIERG